MTNHAVLTVWTLDNHNFDPVARDKLLTEEVVPRVSTLPGFVEGRWNRSLDGVRAYNTVVFDDQAQLAAVDAARLVDLVELHLHCVRRRHPVGCLLYTSPSPRD